MKKRFILVLFVLLLLASFTGCESQRFADDEAAFFEQYCKDFNFTEIVKEEIPEDIYYEGIRLCYDNYNKQVYKVVVICYIYEGNSRNFTTDSIEFNDIYGNPFYYKDGKFVVSTFIIE